MNTPNPEVKNLVDANANPQDPNQGTEQMVPASNPADDAAQPVDYKKKFSESSKEALRLKAERDAAVQEAADAKREAEAAKRGFSEIGTDPVIDDSIYPGFENLDPDAQNTVTSFAKGVTKRVRDEILSDPSIAFGRQKYNETMWESSFERVAQQYPDLTAKKAEFKQKYFNADNVPTNIDTILTDVAKIFLFDNAKAIGAAEEAEKNNRIDLERSAGGSTAPVASRTLEDWERMAKENPAKFAKHSKEYNEDVSSGRV